jgi:hypothetical protein
LYNFWRSFDLRRKSITGSYSIPLRLAYEELSIKQYNYKGRVSSYDEREIVFFLP